MISEEDFLTQIKEISSNPHSYQEWTIEVDKQGTGQCPYLVKRNHKLVHGDDVFNLEFHICRHPSYCVPVLCFNVCASNGTLITEYETIWAIFKSRLSNDQIASVDLYQALTQMDHPVTQKPTWAIHPCQTPALLEKFQGQSANLVLTFLSTFAPFLGLNCDHLMPPRK